MLRRAATVTARAVAATVAVSAAAYTGYRLFRQEDGQVTVLLGAQWGDEGKGKLVDVLFDHKHAGKFTICARSGGGANAGHTIKRGKQRVATHLVPTGALTPGVSGVLGNGTVVHLPSLLKEIDALQAIATEVKSSPPEAAGQEDSEGRNFAKLLDGIESRIFISDRAHIVFDMHKAVDGRQELERGSAKIGTTKQGIGPTYASKANRVGVRVGDLKYWDVFESRFRALAASLKAANPGLVVDVESELKYYRSIRERILRMTTDTQLMIAKARRSGENVLVEGANAIMLDLDLGTYPYVTSSSPSVGGACTGLGLTASDIGEVIGVVKAYTTRVGEGPFPTEQLDDIGKRIQRVGAEFGTTTGRARRCGTVDVPQLRYSILCNGYTVFNLTKLDVLTGLPEIKIATKYLDKKGVEYSSMPSQLRDLEELDVKYETMRGWEQDISSARNFSSLPVEAQAYVTRLEELTGVPIRWIGVGNQSSAMIDRGEWYVTLRKLSLQCRAWMRGEE